MVADILGAVLVVDNLAVGQAVVAAGNLVAEQAVVVAGNRAVDMLGSGLWGELELLLLLQSQLQQLQQLRLLFAWLLLRQVFWPALLQPVLLRLPQLLF